MNHAETITCERCGDTVPAHAALIHRCSEVHTPALSFMAEAMGHAAEAAERPVAARLLLQLLSHPHSLVREGAAYGLAALLDEPGVRQQLEFRASHDVSPGVRQAALEALA